MKLTAAGVVVALATLALAWALASTLALVLALGSKALGFGGGAIDSGGLKGFARMQLREGARNDSVFCE